MWRCEICTKSGMNSYWVSHSNKHTKIWLRTNIQKVRVRVNGGVRRMKVCTSCLKKSRVIKAVWGFEECVRKTIRLTEGCR